MKKLIILFLVVLMMLVLGFSGNASEEYITGYINGETIMLDRIDIGIKTEKLPENGEIDSDFFDNDMISRVEEFVEFPEITYFTVYLKNSDTANLLKLKAFLEAMNIFDSVEFRGFAYLDAVLYDVTLDGNTTADDARFVLRCAVGLEEYTADQLAAGDADFDGSLTASDARVVLRYSVGLTDDERENYALDSLIIKVKSEYIVDDAFETSLLYNEKVKDGEFLIEADDGGRYYVVHLKKPGKENLLQLKDYYESLEAVECVDFNWFFTVDGNI